ncbi:MAG: AAA family ATPase [Bacteroidetes bacterium]|nr:AAA family ATPase [Bacteroidota bacterium]
MNDGLPSKPTEPIDVMDLAFKQFDSTKGLFTVMPGNDWLQQAAMRPVPQMLFSEFWHEGELCILFADTNTGKSILAVQIADSISRGVHIPGFKLDARAQKVVYFDFELFDKQFEARYSRNYTQHYAFSPNMHRAEINPDADIPARYPTFEEYLSYSLEKTVTDTGARILVIDNLTYLRSETERAADAMPLMKELKALKLRYNLSILALAHTPKRDGTKAMNRNDLQGSKALINFCDSSFCIGESNCDKSMRYLKQIKARNTEVVYDSNNVCLCRIEKPHNFLQFTHTGYGKEHEHLKDAKERSREAVEEMVRRLAEENPDWSYRDIAVEAGISKTTVGRILKGDDE